MHSVVVNLNAARPLPSGKLECSKTFAVTCRRAREAARQNEMAERERRTQELLKSCEVGGCPQAAEPDICIIQTVWPAAFNTFATMKALSVHHRQPSWQLMQLLIAAAYLHGAHRTPSA